MKDTRPGPKAHGADRSSFYVVAALMLAVALAALDISVVGTAMPTIAGKLGGLDLFSWVFSIYLLTSTVTVPVYGKLADLYGRKPVILFGAAVFLAGSVLSGASQSMEMLIFFRAIQGLGAGAVLPITITIIGDLFSIEQRAKIQSLFGAVWGVTGVAGPAIGGLITDNIGWRWVFLVNLPFGLASIALIWLFYHERLARRQHALDYPGALLLTGAVVALLIVLLQTGQAYGWTGLETLALTAAALALFAAFIRVELRAAEPVVPLSLFRNSVILVSSLAIFVAGALMFGISSYVPLFEQGVFGGSATRAGLVLAPMSVTWVAGSAISGRTIVRLGFFPAAMTGGFFLLAGSALLLALTDATSIAVAAVAGAIIGMGMGLTTNATTIAVQTAVDWGQRGIATASTQFFRTIGGSIGVAIMGALLNSRMAGRLAAIEGVPEGANADLLLNRSEREALPAATVEAMRHALALSLHEMFFVVFAAALLCVAALIRFPRVRATMETPGGTAPAPAPRSLAEPE